MLAEGSLDSPCSLGTNMLTGYSVKSLRMSMLTGGSTPHHGIDYLTERHLEAVPSKVVFQPRAGRRVGVECPPSRTQKGNPSFRQTGGREFTHFVNRVV